MDNMMSQQDQGQEYAQPQPQQNSPQGSISPANGDEKATTGAEVEYQTRQLWYWVEIAKVSFHFHSLLTMLPWATHSFKTDFHTTHPPKETSY